MFVVTGVTGNTGRAVAEALLEQGQPVRVLVRDGANGAAWSARGAEVAVASLGDRDALARALVGASGWFAILPEDRRIEDFHGHRRALVDAMAAAVRASALEHVVFLSTTAAVLPDGNGAAKDLHYAEAALRATGRTVAVLRATALQENVVAALGTARRDGVYPTFAPSIEARVPMVAARDVGRVAASCLLEPRSEVIDVIGPAYSATEIADLVAASTGRPVSVAVVPPEAQVPALAGLGLPRKYAEAVVELAAIAPRVRPAGDRVHEGTTTLAETLEAVLAGSFERLRREVSRLQVPADALGAVGAAIDAHLSRRPLGPEVAAVLEALGLAVGGPSYELASLLGEIRTMSRCNDERLHGGAKGWHSPDPKLLRAAGDVSIPFPYVLRDRIAPKLDGLEARLAGRGAAFLDVGVGVARMAIEMARVFPELRIVGIDPFAPALELARENVAAAGLGDRIALREQAGEALTDSRAFDLVRVAGGFVPRSAIEPLVVRAHEALRPGGWLLFATFRPPADPLAGALARMRAVELAGEPTPLPEVVDHLRRAGFGAVRELPSPPESSFAMIAARRTEA
jgi:uncharacterized protein YbjT (DUF2867 family)/SAM-dependent methyltransferase